VSSSFNVSNGVRQGGILSPKLFTVYMDELIERLNATGVGCYIGGKCVNNLWYADDTALLSPSVKSMNMLLKVCGDYAVEVDVVYNTAKTVYMIVTPRAYCNIRFPKVKLNNVDLKIVTEYKYLGHFINSTISDTRDIERQYRGSCVRANMLIRRFAMCSEQVRSYLFKTYCTTMYCSALWVCHNTAVMNRLRVLYNNSYRWLMKKPRQSSASEMFVNDNVLTFDALRRKSIYGLCSRLLHSKNTLVQAVRQTTAMRSKIWQYWRNALYV
jgi:hypothetical protein